MWKLRRRFFYRRGYRSRPQTFGALAYRNGVRQPGRRRGGEQREGGARSKKEKPSARGPSEAGGPCRLATIREQCAALDWAPMRACPARRLRRGAQQMTFVRHATTRQSCMAARESVTAPPVGPLLPLYWASSVYTAGPRSIQFQLACLFPRIDREAAATQQSRATGRAIWMGAANQQGRVAEHGARSLGVKR